MYCLCNVNSYYYPVEITSTVTYFKECCLFSVCLHLLVKRYINLIVFGVKLM